MWPVNTRVGPVKQSAKHRSAGTFCERCSRLTFSVEFPQINGPELQTADVNFRIAAIGENQLTTLPYPAIRVSIKTVRTVTVEIILLGSMNHLLKKN